MVSTSLLSEESKNSWNIDSTQELSSSNPKILPESTVEIDEIYDYFGKKYIQFFKFSRDFASILALEFSLSDISKNGATLTMTGSALASESRDCYFTLRINGKFVMEFLAVDSYVKGSKGLEYSNVTKLSIPASCLQVGLNTLELELSNNGFPLYDLRSLTFTNGE